MSETKATTRERVSYALVAAVFILVAVWMSLRLPEDATWVNWTGIVFLWLIILTAAAEPLEIAFTGKNNWTRVGRG